MTDVTLVAGMAGLAAAWNQIKAFAARLRALFITRVTLSGEVASAVFDYIQTNGKILNWGDRMVRSSSSWVRPLSRQAEVAFEAPPLQPLLVLLGGDLFIFHSPSDSQSPSLPCRQDLLILTGLRWRLNVTDLTKKALDAAIKRQTTGRRYRVWRIGGKRERDYGHPSNSLASQPPCELRAGMKFLHWSEQDIGAPQPSNPFESLALCSQGKAAKLDFERWLSLREWYQERGIPWRRGHLYYGPPGTGKTSMARALAQSADIPVYAFDLSTLTNEEFTHNWQNMQENTPCMALIEDIDGTFNGRKNVMASNHRETLSFDCLLNAIGGIQTCDGVFVVVTTNKPEILDDALGRPQGKTSGTSRPGRIDAAYCLELPEKEQRLKIMYRIIGTEQVTADDLTRTTSMSAAQVTEYAITRALELQWTPKTR